MTSSAGVFFHTAIADGNFHPLTRWLEEDTSSWPVAFGFVVARPLAEWFRAQPHYQVLRQIEAGLAALYHTDSEEERQALRCQLHGPVLDRVLEVHDRYFVAGGLDLQNEEKTPFELRAEFDQFVHSHAGSRPPAAFPLFFHLDSLFLGPDGNTADYDLAREEEARWFFEHNDFSLGYWMAYIRDDDWEHIVEKDDYDELQRVEGVGFLYEAWEDFYEKNKLRYPMRQAHWRDIPAELILPG